MTSRGLEVAVVGGGAVGLSCAYELALAGAKPVVLEREPDVLSGCSAGSAGLLSPAHSTPLATPGAVKEGLRHLLRRDSPFSMRPRPGVLLWLARFLAAATAEQVTAGTRLLRDLSIASLKRHEVWAAEGLDTGLIALGALNVYETPQAYAGGRAESAALAEHGIVSEVLDAAAVRAFCPSLTDGIVGGVFYPDEAQCDPERFLPAVAAAAIGAGAEIHTRAEVLDVVARRGRVVALDTTEGRLPVGEVVVANGAWSAVLARRLGRPLPVLGAKGYHVDLAPAAATDPTIPIYLQEARVIATPFADRMRLAGTLQLTGLDTSVDAVRVDATLQSGIRALRGVSGERVTGVWRGIRPCTPDGLPVIGRSERLANAVFATGHAMKGLHLAPETGRLVAQLITDPGVNGSLEPFSPDRFGGILGRRTERSP